MTTDDVFSKFKALGNETLRRQNIKRGAHENQFGVKLGDIRNIAKKIKTDNKLAKALWETGNMEARLLSTLIIDTQLLSTDELDSMVRSEHVPQVADWLNAYVVKEHPEKEALRQRWMQTDHPMAARAGWSLTGGRIARSPEGLDIPALLDRIEAEMPGAAPETQWTMNMALAYIGIYHAAYRERALAIGDRLGIYRDYPVSKGCTSPFAPIWINEMVKRQG
ncbi:DNA alkylation repair protein [Mucilaginibacter hurinus]|uniref:DNA alkylation repair protein n=1 Tax=Mucilaginibacter hurinus TaxID=2201324 RepID=A0A367GQ89_9SPHI|nr:DNA alkylation repair protein [Mucilaginibacter hurinus]RCH54873.1 DNA alkylation repair protein [Mucilaginibacter hurinus]